MTKTGRIIGAILAMVGGFLALLSATIYSVQVSDIWGWDSPMAIGFYVTVVLGVVSIIGGILLIKDISAGGILALVAGAVMVLGFVYDAVGGMILVKSFFMLDLALMITGGILGIVIKSEK